MAWVKIKRLFVMKIKWIAFSKGMQKINHKNLGAFNQFIINERRLLRDENKAIIRRSVPNGFKSWNSAGGLHTQSNGRGDINQSGCLWTTYAGIMGMCVYRCWRIWCDVLFHLLSP
jgi:hypothetical protein